ncbi:MAG: cytochrome c biogenesis protein CcdA [Patescibacteria group bacterium]
MELLLSASLIAAFIAGIAALFAPCCITVLLPAYFGSIFRERYKVFLMTFIFFLGILTVFLPIGLGVAALGKLFSQYHNIIFGIGSTFLTILGIFLLTGIHFSLPMRVSPALKKHNAVSVFVLGIFSGIATTCCAPVLAGVLALATLPSSIFWGGFYTLSFVLGMVAPLFIISLFLDKINFEQKFLRIFSRPIRYRLIGKEISITVSEAV